MNDPLIAGKTPRAAKVLAAVLAAVLAVLAIICTHWISALENRLGDLGPSTRIQRDEIWRNFDSFTKF